MSRYFFDCNTGEQQFRDDVGIDLSDMKSVAAEAYGLLRDLIQGEMPEGLRTYSTTVRDEAGAVVYRGEMTVRGRRGTGDD